MAIFPGLDLLSNFAGIFTLLFAFAVIYGILNVVNLFGDKSKTLNPLIAISGSLLLLLSNRFVGVVEAVAPWFVIMAFMLFFMLLLLRFAGVEESAITNFFKTGRQRQTVIYTILISVLLLMLYGVSQEFGQDVGPYLGSDNTSSVAQSTAVVSDETGTDNFQQNFGATIFHPKVLGLVAILLIGSFAIRFMVLAES
jgi:hypothetical protein